MIVGFTYNQNFDRSKITTYDKIMYFQLKNSVCLEQLLWLYFYTLYFRYNPGTLHNTV